jgi:hypothetical protein
MPGSGRCESWVPFRRPPGMKSPGYVSAPDQSGLGGVWASRWGDGPLPRRCGGTAPSLRGVPALMRRGERDWGRLWCWLCLDSYAGVVGRGVPEWAGGWVWQ